MSCCIVQPLFLFFIHTQNTFTSSLPQYRCSLPPSPSPLHSPFSPSPFSCWIDPPSLLSFRSPHHLLDLWAFLFRTQVLFYSIIPNFPHYSALLRLFCLSLFCNVGATRRFLLHYFSHSINQNHSSCDRIPALLSAPHSHIPGVRLTTSSFPLMC